MCTEAGVVKTRNMARLPSVITRKHILTGFSEDLGLKGVTLHESGLLILFTVDQKIYRY